MTGFSLGPLVIPAGLLPWLAAILTAALTAWLRGRKRHRPNIEPLLWWAVLAGLAAARVAFVIQYHDSFSDNWVGVLDIRDGGFWWPAGLVFGLLVWALAPAAGKLEERHERLIVGAAGLAAALPVIMIVVALHPVSSALPSLTLQDIEGRPVTLADKTDGQPTLVNIWASWCPHCHRSMPALEQAQSLYPQVRLVLVNQGEAGTTVVRYMHEHGFAFEHVLLDPLASLATAIGSRGVPTTLILDADGNVMSIHSGGLSAARIRQILQPLAEPVTSSSEVRADGDAG